MMQYIDAISDQTCCNGESPDPIVVYDGITPLTSTTPAPLFKLMYHILSICPNSASCKWLFRIFSNTLTKLWNHLGKSNTHIACQTQDAHMHQAPACWRNQEMHELKLLFSSPSPLHLC